MLGRHAGRVLLAAAMLACAGLTATAGPVLAHGKMHCYGQRGNAVSGSGTFDPIVYPGLEPAGHDHTFLANRRIMEPGQRANATYSYLVGDPNTPCQNIGDTAAYWFPTIYQVSGEPGARVYQPLQVGLFIAYYRSFQGMDVQTGFGNEAYPPDLRMIAGDGHAVGPQPTNRVNWTCNQGSNRFGPWTSAVQAACNTATGSVVRLGFHVDFPSCWSGTLNSHLGPTNTADASGSHPEVFQQVLYPTGSPPASRACPTGFPHKLSMLRMSVQLKLPDGSDYYRGDGTDLALSSGPRDPQTGELLPGEASQWTLHADFWNTWTQGTAGTTGSTLNGMIGRCINTSTAHPHGSSTVCGS